jgi:hypothetical protein
MTEPRLVRSAGAGEGMAGPLMPREGQQSTQRGPAESASDDRRPEYRSVTCAHCGATVLAAKFSFQHTSVQWDASAVARCAEFGRRVAAGEQTPLIERCEAMRASIDAAAFDGRLPVAPP